MEINNGFDRLTGNQTQLRKEPVSLGYSKRNFPKRDGEKKKNDNFLKRTEYQKSVGQSQKI